MPKGAKKGAGPGKRHTGSSKSKKTHKQNLRKIFQERHIDQIWEDVRRAADDVHDGRKGPLGTTDKVKLDEDVPAHGQHFCIACSRYFINATALTDHNKSKDHKRRVKELKGTRPHRQRDAEAAAGMGTPDNGPPLGGAGLPTPMAI